ncbi:alpha/beta fold hydrolase, partial [Ramlibacter sp. 2FC]|uniref:esterase/lipase family protein n=1 Tax=Ramlibacter sp. 2FC TaxID=2502188 RepID=UPI0010F4AB45
LQAGPGGEGRRGVVLVHGFACNRGLWNPWLRRLRAEGRVFLALNLEPVFGSIDAYVTQIEDAVARVSVATGLPPVLVCHSMGGLAARAWLRLPGAERRVHHVVTIATPHRGTWLGHFSAAVNARQMQLGSAWLAELASQEPPARAARFTCWYSDCDNVVLPYASAMLQGARNRLVPGLPHVALALCPQVIEATLEAIRQDRFDGAA